MLKFQMGLIALLIGCVALISCGELINLLTPPEEDVTDDPIVPMMVDLPDYASWLSVTYPNPVGTGGAHGEGARAVYINEIGATAAQDDSVTAFPAGTTIVKEIMDDANTFVQKIATMMKTDDPMYADHNGWTYKKYARPDENSDYTQVRGDGLPDAAEGCHGCHAAAPKDSVFVDFSMDDTTTDDGTMPDDMTMEDDMMPTDSTLPITVDLSGYTAWMSNPLPGPIGTGGAHGQNARTIYINDVGAMALQDASVTAYPVGTTVVKDIMDDTNTSVRSRAIMVKTDNSTFTDHNGWIYAYVDVNAESVEVGGSGIDGQGGCHNCHAAAGTGGVPGMDGVFAFQPAGMEGEGQ